MAAWEKEVFIKCEFNKGCVLRVHKELSKLTKKITCKKWTRYTNSPFSKEVWVPNKRMKKWSSGRGN